MTSPADPAPSTAWRRAAAAAVLVAVALAAAWLVPLLAAVAVWPLLFLIPGWALIGWVRRRIGLAGRIGLAVVLSVAISTHLVYWLSILAGTYDRWVVFVAAAILALPIPIAAVTGGQAPAPIAFRRARSPLAVAALGALVVGTTLAVGLWRVTPDGVSSGGSNWSDLGVHLSIAQSLNAGGNFPPEVPYFAGAQLIYHWFADFHAAIAAEAAGLFSAEAMVVQSTVMAAALPLLTYGLARRLLRGPWARRAAVIAATLVVFGGGMGYIRLIGDLANGMGSPLELITTQTYDNTWYDTQGEVAWPYFRIPSVMGTGLLVHRATTVGLPIFAGAMLLLLAGLPTARARAAGWRDRPALLVLAGLLGALLAPFQFFFFPALPLVVLAWVVAGGRLIDRDAPHNAALFLFPYVLAIPFILAPALQAGDSGAVRVVQGWQSAPLDDGLAGIAFFYVTNLGVPFLLALAALLLPGLGRVQRAFIATWVVLLFAIPNVVQLSIIDFDMNKYFQAMWIAVAIAAAWLIRRWAVPALAVVVLLSVPSPLLVAAWTATSNLGVLSRDEHDAARWVAANTPPGSVFVTSGWVNSLTDAAGRLRVLTFPPYVANLGFDPDERVEQVRSIYCDADPARSAQLMRSLDATYVVSHGLPADCHTPTDFSQGADFELVYSGGSVQIYHLTGE